MSAIDDFSAVPRTFIWRRRRSTPSSPPLPVSRRQGRDVPAAHRHGAVGAFDDMIGALPRRSALGEFAPKPTWGDNQ